MTVLVLAAGYATRLYPLTLTRPKPLLDVAGKPMIDYVMDNLAPIGGIERVFVVTNAKFAGQFQEWADGYSTRAKLNFKVINDGSTDDTNKLGAIGDLHLVMRQEKLDEDLIVVAGDNLFSEPLTGFGELIRKRHAPVLGVFDVGSREQAKKYGVVAVDGEGVIIEFIEKPANPPSTLISVALYYYPRATLQLVHQYIADGNNPDQPGRLAQWLYPRQPVYTWRVPGKWFDIGSKETLEEANRIFAKS
jgi:glucose-1-phosphate thymidylyltransferase